MLTDSGINMHDFMHPLKMLYKNNIWFNLLLNHLDKLEFADLFFQIS